MTTRNRISRWAHRLAMAAMAAALVGCGAPGAAMRAVTSSSDDASEGSSLTASIVDSMQGVHIDVLGGGEPSPGRTTTRVTHIGTTAVEDYWTTDGWCRSRTYAWSIGDATDAQHFTVTYNVTWEDASCMSHWGDTVDLFVTAVETDGDHIVIEGRYDSVWNEATTRTVCSDALSPACSI